MPVRFWRNPDESVRAERWKEDRPCCAARRLTLACVVDESGEEAMSDFKGRHFAGEIVVWAILQFAREQLELEAA